MKKILFAAATATVFVSTVAIASVTFDSSTGTGFVDKGDVQTALGWNNETLQTKASKLKFLYKVKNTFDVQCYWETLTSHGTVVVHDVAITKTVGERSTVAYAPRVANQITGFNLTGFGTTTYSGTMPVVGGACPKKKPGTIVAVTDTTTDFGKLLVQFKSRNYQLPWPA